MFQVCNKDSDEIYGHFTLFVFVVHDLHTLRSLKNRYSHKSVSFYHYFIITELFKHYLPIVTDRSSANVKYCRNSQDKQKWKDCWRRNEIQFLEREFQFHGYVTIHARICFSFIYHAQTSKFPRAPLQTFSTTTFISNAQRLGTTVLGNCTQTTSTTTRRGAARRGATTLLPAVLSSLS